MIEVVKTCPFGHTCKKVVDDHIEECMWYVHMEGENPQNGDKIDRAECAMVWQPLLMIENSRETNRVSATVQELRNDVHVRSGIGVVGNAQRNIEHN